MDSTVRTTDGQLEISFPGSHHSTFRLSVDDWRTLNKSVEAVIHETFISYDDACTRLGIHRSTLGDWIAQGTLARVLIDRRGYIDASQLPTTKTKRHNDARRSRQDSHQPEPAPRKSKPKALSLDAQKITGMLTDRDNAVVPSRFPADAHQADQPGMYAWWCDDEARAALGGVLDVVLPQLLYVGQAGATKWPSGRRSAATLRSRIASQHVRGNASSSTFRLTVSSLLVDALSLKPTSNGKLDAVSNMRVSAWIAEHLRVAIAPYADRNSLGHLEGEVVAHLDPPLNLDHCPPSEIRTRLALRRRAFRSGSDC